MGELEGAFFKSKIFLLFPFREWLKTALVFLFSLARSLSRVTIIRLSVNAIRLPTDSLIVSADTIRKPTRSSRQFWEIFWLKIAKIGQFLQKKGGLINRWGDFLSADRENGGFLAAIGEHSFVKF